MKKRTASGSKASNGKGSKAAAKAGEGKAARGAASTGAPKAKAEPKAAKAEAKTAKGKKAAPAAQAEAPKKQLPLTPVQQILANNQPTKKGRRGKRETAKTLGVYDADRDILDQYLYEVSQTPLLTPAQEIAIARLVRAGDPEAMQELVKRNLRFVISVAKKYQNRGLPLTDLIGEGNVGLLTAARKFDPDQGVKFISYAVWWIRQAILASLARQGRTVRVPLNRTADLSRIVRTAEALRQELRREPTPEEIAKSTGLSLEVVQSLAALNTSDVRLDAPLDPEGDRSLIERFIADDQADAEEEAMDRFLTDEIEGALATLPARDAKVLRLYFGLDGGREHTLEEIGGMLGVTRERVRQLRDRALKRLREGEVGRALASFAA
jgi:RNA polymerase primary sigma factor